MKKPLADINNKIKQITQAIAIKIEMRKKHTRLKKTDVFPPTTENINPNQIKWDKARIARVKREVKQIVKESRDKRKATQKEEKRLKNNEAKDLQATIKSEQ